MDKDEALKLALEALQWNWGGEPLPTLELQAINAIKEALAQSDDLTIAYMAGFYDGKNKYAPRREWVGLTDEERDHFEGLHLYAARNQVEAWIEGVPAFIDAIEAKLREKNGIKEET